MAEFWYVYESKLDSSRIGISIDPENRLPLLFMVTPELPKPPYLAFHDGTTWQKVLTTPINDQGKMTNTYIDGKPKLT